ncbi:MAG: SDR family oxidoreductase [Inhella sp.]|jgi:NAD(P)-dependent dehydrogenase (short-subunit alcohol dehydrogenase family)|uniref:SDR family oxidoreductase n=1 Tax=Inhella sp. TaxID=1921806 RepID=UPI0022C8D890|nr:SDR family oxidoreductase [Inhella sp.]MCZ8233646.1 SDR family oxidoreductase [Inhella sp.]
MTHSILLTGAAGGFGRLIAKTLLDQGHRLVATMREPDGRNREAAQALSARGARVIAMDVTDDASVAAGVAQASQALGFPDVVIHNAGVGVLGLQEAFSADDLKRLFEINLFGVHRVNRTLLPAWRSRRSGLMVNVSSLLGRITMPFYGPYNASKWALEALSENYRSELSAFGIEVCIVEPGGYATSFIDHLMRPSDAACSATYGAMAEAPQQMLQHFEQVLAATPEQNPQRVADAIAALVGMPAGGRPFRTTVDALGMGAAVEGYNGALAEVTAGLYKNFGIEHMLTPQRS